MINLGFSAFTYENDTDTGPAEFYITDEGITEPSETLYMDEMEITGTPPDKKKFPWWLLLVAGGIGVLNMRG